MADCGIIWVGKMNEKSVYTITDVPKTELTKTDLDMLFLELDKELRRKYRNQPHNVKADLFVVGGACAVTALLSRTSTTDVDALWTVGYEMKDAINKVGDKFGLGHTWCNQDFKRTKSFTPAIYQASYIYKEYIRLIVRMANPDLMLGMKLIALDRRKEKDLIDLRALAGLLRSNGYIVNTEFCLGILEKYYNGKIKLDEYAMEVIRRL